MVDNLPVNPLITVNLGFERRDEKQYTAIYIPEQDFLVNRVSYPGIFSPENLPSDSHFLIQAEITSRKSDSVMNWTDQQLITHVLEWLKKRGVLLTTDIPAFEYVDRIKHAYVVYTSDFESVRDEIIKYFESKIFI